MRVPYKDLAALQNAAMGVTKCDLAIQNIKFVNLFTGERYPAVVYVKDGFVCHVDHFCNEADHDKVTEIIDGNGDFLIPGFVDAHAHIESSMCTPRNYARAVLPHGTTTVIIDPHEIANVLGEEGVRYMSDAGDDLPMRQLIDIPSCVPAVPGLETAGAEFDADTVTRLSKLPRVVGLAEVMDFVGAATGDARMTSIIQAARDAGLYIQGHIPADDPRLLSSYLIGGPTTCHETRVGADAVLKLRSGMFVDARQSSISQDLPEIVPAVSEMRYLDRLSLCTDDREADDIIAIGHMDDVVRKAIQYGLDPVDAIRSATFNPAREARLENIGAIAPGYVADMLLISHLAGDFKVRAVFFGGRMVASEGKLVLPIEDMSFAIEQRNTMNLPELTVDDFRIPAPDPGAAAVRVNVLSYPSPEILLTEVVEQEIPVTDGALDVSGMDDINYVIIINRYGKNNITRGLIRNFGLKQGANGSTVSHDCHNLAIVYADLNDAFKAYEALRDCGGGMCCVQDGQVTLLPLPLAGLMSLEPCAAVAANIQQLKEALWTAGMPQPNPMMRITTMALPVIPKAQYSDLGLVDVLKKEFIPIFPEQ